MDTITNSKAAEGLLHEKLSTLDHEEVWIIYLTIRHTVIGSEMLSKGTLSHTSLDSRTVMRQALLHNAGCIIILHNHPCGDATPSKADILFTSNLRKACAIMGINLIDHIIVAKDTFFSFCDEQTHIK